MVSPRAIVRHVATGLAFLFVIPIASEFAIEMAREHGFFDRPTSRVVAMMEVVSGFTSQWWASYATVALVFFASGLWVDALLRSPLAKMSLKINNEYKKSGLTSEITGEHLELVEGKSFKDEAVVFDNKHFMKCYFENCTIILNSAAWKIEDCKIEPGNYQFLTSTITTSSALVLLKAFGMLGPSMEGNVMKIPKSALELDIEAKK